MVLLYNQYLFHDNSSGWKLLYSLLNSVRSNQICIDIVISTDNIRRSNHLHEHYSQIT